MQGLAERWQAQRLHMVLNVGVWPVGAALGECAQLRGGHAHRPAALEHIFHANLRLAPQAVGQRVQGFNTLHFKHGAYLQMVLQVGTHTGFVQLHVNAVLLQQAALPYAR